MKLWDQLADWKNNCKWVELSREVSTETVHWAGFPTMEDKKLFDVVEHGFNVNLYNIVSQYGTHVDAPWHFVAEGRTLETFGINDMVMPLCVIDASAKCAENADYALAIEVAPYFGIDAQDAKKIIADICRIVSNWQQVATQYHISREEQQRKAPAFRI